MRDPQWVSIGLGIIQEFGLSIFGLSETHLYLGSVPGLYNSRGPKVEIVNLVQKSFFLPKQKQICSEKGVILNVAAVTNMRNQTETFVSLKPKLVLDPGGQDDLNPKFSQVFLSPF